MRLTSIEKESRNNENLSQTIEEERNKSVQITRKMVETFGGLQRKEFTLKNIAGIMNVF